VLAAVEVVRYEVIPERVWYVDDALDIVKYVLAAVVVSRKAPAPPMATTEVAEPPTPPVPTPMNNLLDASE
jgi:hypothetical protein